jgi:hypothetical protein
VNPEATSVTVAISDLVGSFTLVTTTCAVPVAVGAVYWPFGVTDPPDAPSCTLQSTAGFRVKVTVSENARTPDGPRTSLVGEILTATGAVTTVAVWLFVVSALLVATTWKVPKLPGAVYIPVEEMVPPAAPSAMDQEMPLFTDPVTEAVNVRLSDGDMLTEEGLMGETAMLLTVMMAV